jgi:F-box protein 11
MSTATRETLHDLIHQYGPTLCETPFRVEGFLKDLCGEQPRQIHLLKSALEERVAAELLVSSGLPTRLVLERLALRLQDRRVIEAGAARWAVESWAIALGVLPADQATAPTLALASPEPVQPALASPAGAVVPSLVVSQQGNGQFTTISAALQQAAPRTRILVHPGRYQETLVLDKPVELFAVTNGPQESVLVESHSASCLIMQTALATVSGLHFWSRRTDADLDGSGYAIDIGQGRLVLEDCDVRSDFLACVGSYGPATPLLRRCTLHESGIGVLVTEMSQPEIVDCEFFGHEIAGIQVRRGGHPTARNCRVHDGAARGLVVEEGMGLFEDCAFFGHTLSEVEIGRAGDLTLRRCVLSKGKASGLLAREQSRGLLEGCTISEQPQNGVEIHAGAQLEMRDTRISKCQRGILLDQAGPGVIERCELFANTEVDIACTHQSQPVVRSCTLRAGKKVGLLVTGSSRPTIEQCRLFGHGVAEVVIKEQSDPVIRHSQIQDGRGVGVLVHQQGRGQLAQCLISGHRLSGIEIAQESHPALRSCHIHNGQQDGILVHSRGQGLVEDCRIFRNQRIGIELKGGSTLTVKGCWVSEQVAGIVFRGQCGGQVEHSTLANHRLCGIEVHQHSAPVIVGCELRLNGASGIGFFAGAQGTVEQCTLESNTLAGILIKQESNPVIRDCLIRWGKQAGILIKEQGRGLIEACAVEWNELSGVEIKEASQPVLHGCQIEQNGTGVLVWKGGAGTLEGCSMAKNNSNGVEIREHGRPVLTGCQIKENLFIGVFAHDEGEGIVEDCVLWGNLENARLSWDSRVVWRRNQED